MTPLDPRYTTLLASLAHVLGDLLGADPAVSWVVIVVQHDPAQRHRVGVVSDLDTEDTRALFRALAGTVPDTLFVPRTRRTH